MILAIIGVIIGFVLLVKGADFFVEGSGSVAKKFNIPVFIIGMTIVAMGTSAPECAVSISASLRGINGMAISNVIGSNIFNLLVVCGVCALFQPLVIKKETLKKEFPFFCTGSSDYWRDGTGRNDGRTYGWNYSGCEFLPCFCTGWFVLQRSPCRPEKMLKQKKSRTCQSGNVWCLSVAAWLLL